MFMTHNKCVYISYVYMDYPVHFVAVCTSTSTDSQVSMHSDDNNGTTVIALIVILVVMAIGLIVAIAIIILLMRTVKQLKSL